MMYVYNTCKYPLSDYDVKTVGTAEAGNGGTTIIRDSAVFLPHQWTSTSNLNIAAFEQSMYHGKIKSFIEKGYLRVLSAEEYLVEIKKVQREKDLAIPVENDIPQGLAIYGKAIRDNKESSKFSSLIEDDEELEEESYQQKEDSTKIRESDDRFSKLENAIYNLSQVVSSLVNDKKPARKTSKKSVKKISKKSVEKKVKNKKVTKKKVKK